MERWGDAPLPEGVEQNVVRAAALVAMELVEQTVTRMKLVGILDRVCVCVCVCVRERGIVPLKKTPRCYLLTDKGEPLF